MVVLVMILTTRTQMIEGQAKAKTVPVSQVVEAHHGSRTIASLHPLAHPPDLSDRSSSNLWNSIRKNGSALVVDANWASYHPFGRIQCNSEVRTWSKQRKERLC